MLTVEVTESTGRARVKSGTAVFFVAVGALLLLDALVVSLSVPMNTGIIATFVIGGGYVLHGLHRRTREGPSTWVSTLVLLVHVPLVLVIAFVAVFGRTDTVTYTEDAVVVLGTAIDGERVTPALRNRLETAVEYVERNPDALVVVAGGRGPGESITEALAMERFLRAQGVAPRAILEEERSTSTAENFAFTKNLLDARLEEGYTTLFVTNDFHVLRANELSRRAGLESTHLHAGTPWYEVPVDYTRELLALGKFLAVGS
ncbi:YdcF family protein [Promicromonospora sp. NPDC050880]|uniref:YdcF family protein n=1 Tax=Promicromonospora sp. NPDC050880 TaxID=3364406 RepID=UPI00379398D1